MFEMRRNILVWGKDGCNKGPTEDYPRPVVVEQFAELIRDVKGGPSVWKFQEHPGDPGLPNYVVKYSIGGQSNWLTQEEAFAEVDRVLLIEEYEAKQFRLRWEYDSKVDSIKDIRRKLEAEYTRDYEEKLKTLNEEYKGRIPDSELN